MMKLAQPPPSAHMILGRGTRKDAQLTVSDLIRAREVEAILRESDAALRKELAVERRRHGII